MPKAFIDASVLIAAVLSRRGYANDLMILGSEQIVELVFSWVVFEETKRIIISKAPETMPDFSRLYQHVADSIVDPSQLLVEHAARIVHVKDAPIVAAAVHARADWLATFDRRHLLSKAMKIRSEFGVIVATPEDSVLALNEATDDR